MESQDPVSKYLEGWIASYHMSFSTSALRPTAQVLILWSFSKRAYMMALYGSSSDSEWCRLI